MLLAKKDGVPVTADGKYARHGEAAHDRHQRRSGQEVRRGRGEPVREARLQAELPDRHAGRAVHEVLRRAKAKVAICPNVGFFKDFVDPESFINPTFNGEAILPANNTNWPQLDDKAINAAIDRPLSCPGHRARARRSPRSTTTSRRSLRRSRGCGQDPLIESKDVQGVADNYSTVWHCPSRR